MLLKRNEVLKRSISGQLNLFPPKQHFGTPLLFLSQKAAFWGSLIDLFLRLFLKRKRTDKHITIGSERVKARKVINACLTINTETAGEFSSPWSTFCADSYFGIRSTPVLPQ